MVIRSVPANQSVAATTQADTINALLQRSKRTAVPIRKTFVQQGTGKTRTPGPLAELVHAHDERALDLYLLVHAVCSGGEFDVSLPAVVWARAIGLGTTTSSTSAVSKSFRRLEDAELIERSRNGSRLRVTLRNEDGHGGDYAHPAADKQPYLKLPHEYWLNGWHLRLALRAKTMLLIALSLNDDFPLPADKASPWYGISADTAQRGLHDLRTHQLLDVREHTKTAPLSPLGVTVAHHHTLRAPFGPRQQPVATVTKLRTKRDAS